MSDWNGEEPMNSHRRPKRRARQVPESSSESDSDITLPRTFKRRRTQRISSDSVSSSSSSSSIFQNHRRRRDILRVMSDSDNGSDSNSPLVLRGGRRKVPRVLNDAETSSESETSGEEMEKNEDEESEESGVHSSSESEDLASSEEGSDDDEDAEWQTDCSLEQDEEIQRALQESLATSRVTEPKREKQGNEHQTVPANIAAPSATGFLSDSSDGESEKCPICLLSFSTQEIGTPESCDHSFCVTCLEEWSKNMTTCPVDRQPFTLILVRRHLEGKVTRKIPVEARRLDDGSPDDDPDPTFCEVCGRSDREDRLLLCDGCDLGYHLECLDPPMETVPVEEWFCQDCTLNNSRIAEEEEMHEGELMELLDDAQDVLIRPRTSRLLPRTRQSERVRATILSRHRAAAEPAMQPSTSGIESLGTESTTSNGSSRKKSSTTISSRKRRKGVRRQTKKCQKKTTRKTSRTPSSKRKTKSSSKISSKTGDNTIRKTKWRKKRKLSRRKLKVSRRRVPRVPRVIMPLSVKGRLAEQLGMCPPSRPGTTLPVVKSRPTSDIDSLRSRAGIPTLHLFGQRDQLDYFSGSDEEIGSLGGGLAVLPRRSNTSVYSARSLASRKALSAVVIRSHRPASSQQRRANLVAAQHTGDSASQSQCDLIGSILDSQSIWHSSKAKVTISRDGSLEVKRETIETARTGTESNKLGVGFSRSANKLSTDHTDCSGNGSSASLTSNLPLNVRDALGRGKQAPLYPGSSNGSRPPSGGSGFHQFGGNRYGNNSSNNNTSSYQNYQSGRGYSNFSAGLGFDANIARAGYSNYLNRTPPPPPPPPLSFRGSPMRFRLSPRFPLRRPPVPPPRLPVPLLKRDEMKTDDSGEGSKRPQDEEEDEIDIYSDIEMGGVGSGGPSGGGSEPDETERGMDVNYEALPPPPEPSALLMGLGEQVLSDDEQESDSELVIDDNVMSTSPHEQSDSTPQIPDSEKYDPAEPSYDSDEDLPLPPSSAVSNEDIPLPSVPPSGSGKSSHDAGISRIVNSSSNSNISYLHSPTYGDKPSFESGSKTSALASGGIVNQVVKEVLKEHLDGTIKTCPVPADAEEEEGEECPNFSIYSALSMDIARKTGEEEEDIEAEQDGKEKERDDEEKREKAKRLSDIEDEVANAAVIVIESDKQPLLQEEEGQEEVEESGKIEEIEKDKDSDMEDNLSNSECSGSEDQLPPEMETEIHSKDNSESERISGKHATDETRKLAALNDELHTVTLKVPRETSPSNELLDDQVKCDDTVSNEEIEAEMKENEEQHRSASEPREISELRDSSLDVSADEKSKTQGLVEEIFGSDDNDSLIGGATSAVSAATMDNNLPVSTPLGLEGLDTETISETEETINFDDDLSQDGNEFLTAEEDGEIPSHKRKKKRKFRKLAGVISKEGGDQGDSEMSPVEAIDYEEGEIVDDRPKNQDLGKKEKKLVDKKDKVKHRDESRKSPDENFDISQSKGVTEEDKKKRKKKSGEKVRVSRERTILGSSENKDKGRDKSRRSEENISWKKPSKSTKGRNYRDGKTTKDDPVMKDKDRESSAKDVGGKKEKKKKEKRKDMERYDVRKVVSDKKRKRRDEFGRDLSRERSVSHSRSRSRRRSRDRSRQRSRSRSKRRSRGRSPVRSRGNRSRSRSRIRSRSRSRVRSRSRSRNRSSRRSKERLRRSRSKDRIRSRISRSHSRVKRSRTRSRSRSKNRQRIRSRSRSVVRSRERKDRTHTVKDTQRFRVRRSWSRTWTPSWSRSRSRSVSCSSYSRSRSPSVRHFNHSYTRSFSRSWSRERHERIPVLEKKTMSKTQKKLTVIVNNTKDDSERQRKKEKKRKENRKNKESTVAVEKRKKRKEKSPAPSKEVFTSGDNILVSVNFNKSNKTSVVKDVPSTALTTLPKDTGKRKRDETFEGDVDPGKKARKTKVVKDKGSPRLKGSSVPEKTTVRSLSEKKSKKQVAKSNKSARMAAILKQKPVAIIDLDQSPFHEQTPSPTDLIVLSDSDETGNKTGEMEEMIEAMSGRRVMRTNSATPPSSSKTVHNVTPGMSATRTPESHSPLMSAISNYLVTSTGPKTPPEPQVKFSIAPKPQLRSINNPLLEEEDDMLVEHAGLEDSDQRIEEELDRGLGDIVHKGPNTPPEPRGPTTPCSPPTSPDAYDPFDPTKSGTPSPAGPEASMDGPPSPVITPTDELLRVGGGGAATTGGGRDSALASDLEDLVNKNVEPRAKSPTLLSGEEIAEERSQSPDRTKSRMDSVLTKSPSGIPESVSVTSQLPSDDLSQSGDLSESMDKVKAKSSLTLPSNVGPAVVSESSTISPERKISVVITTQTPKLQGTPVKQQIFPVTGLKQIPVSQQNITSTPNHSNAPAPLFPTLTPANIASILCTPPTNLTLSRTNLFSTPTPISVPPLLQHIASSPAVPTARITADKTPARLTSDKAPGSGLPLRAMVQNGEQQKQPQDTSTEVVDMDLDSPYSPGSSEGDDLFDPPIENTKSNQQSFSSDRSRSAQQLGKNTSKLLGLPLVPLPAHKSPSKPPQDKFDSIFGVSPLRVNKSGATSRATSHQNKSHHKITKVKAGKHGKGGRKEIAIKMDEDQLQILDDLPSSAVELQVKDKFLKKLNRQERVVEEVKLSLKPHYTKKHITKEEYKDILRKSVPKICHNKSGEINPVKISSLVEAYVRKYRYSKKKNNSTTSNATPVKPKTFSGPRKTSFTKLDK